METYAEYMKRHEEKQRKLKDELSVLILHYTNEELEKRFFKDFGCINFISDEVEHELNLAQTFHDFDKKLHPEIHHLTESEPYRCYHVSKCKCGFCTACDSSD